MKIKTSIFMCLMHTMLIIASDDYATSSSGLTFDQQVHKFYDDNNDTIDQHVNLYNAVKSGNIHTVQEALKHTNNPNLPTNYLGVTPLARAALKGYTPIVELLLNMPTIKIDQGTVAPGPSSGTTPLAFASEHGYLKIVELLLLHGADPNRARRDGATPLYMAVQQGNIEIVKLLLQYDANPNQAMNNGFTPLHSAITCNINPSIKLKLVELLVTYLEKYKEPIKINNDGLTPYDYLKIKLNDPTLTQEEKNNYFKIQQIMIPLIIRSSGWEK